MLSVHEAVFTIITVNSELFSDGECTSEGVGVWVCGCGWEGVG